MSQANRDDSHSPSKEEDNNHLTSRLQALLSAVQLRQANVEDVVQLLLQTEYSDGLRTLALDTVCGEIAVDGTTGHRRNDTRSLNINADKFWESVGRALQAGRVRPDQQEWIIDEALKRAKDKNVSEHIFPHCSKDQLNAAVSPCLSRGLWRSVHFLTQEENTSVKQREDMIQHVADHASDFVVQTCVVPHCTGRQAESILPGLLARRQWHSLSALLKRGVVSRTVHRQAVERAVLVMKEESVKQLVLPRCTNISIGTVLRNLASRHMWSAFAKLLRDKDWEKHYPKEMKDAIQAAPDKAVHRNLAPLCTSSQLVSFFLPCLIECHRTTVLRNFIYKATKAVFCLWLVHNSGQQRAIQLFWDLVTSFSLPPQQSTFPDHMAWLLSGRHSEVKNIKDKCKVSTAKCDLLFSSLLHVVSYMICDSRTYAQCGISRDVFCDPADQGRRHVLEFICQSSMKFLTTADPVNRLGSAVLLTFSAIVTVLPQYRRNTLPFIMQHLPQWEALAGTCLCHFSEQVRRELLQAAVEQKQWRVVRHWGDHTLHDDQRFWAMEAAYRDKQWHVMLTLADHAVTDTQLFLLYNRCIQHGGWDVIDSMMNQGVDPAEIKDTLCKVLSRCKGRQQTPPQALINKFLKVLHVVDKQLQPVSPQFYVSALKRRRWRHVLLCVLHNASPKYCQVALQTAVTDKAWRVVVPLLRLGGQRLWGQRDALFTDMLQQRQWAVCAALLEQGVGIQYCLKALPVLMDSDQWTLVARVMESDVGDDWRRRVMWRAMDRREGSVVWRCISTMERYRLSEAEREQLFQQGMICGVWQAVKPLVEKKDGTGTCHRDTAFLAAIQQHKWDAVDYCQIYGADVNVKDEHQDTPLIRAARSEDWVCVKELVVRGADPNILDQQSYSVINRSIVAEQWPAVKLLIEYQSDIHQPAIVREMTSHDPIINRGSRYQDRREIQTPLQLLIEGKQGALIDHTLLWCPDQYKGLSKQGETTIHALCASGCEGTIYYHVRRGVNPLALTKYGHSALAYAVLNKDCPQKMVADCLMLGLSTHQPALTNFTKDWNIFDLHRLATGHGHNHKLITSPFMLATYQALLSGDFPVPVLHMLYESGSASQAELFTLHTLFETYRHSQFHAQGSSVDKSNNGGEEDSQRGFHKQVEQLSSVVQKMATSPRRLMPQCRLVISHSLDPCNMRHRDIQGLALLSPAMKKYVMFHDLTHPDYGKAAAFEHIPPLLNAIRKMEEGQGENST